MATFRELSRQEWSGGKTLEEINAGSLQRIASATEKMASNYTQLQNDRDYWKRRYNEESESHAATLRSLAALKGALTRAKNRQQPTQAEGAQ